VTILEVEIVVRPVHVAWDHRGELTSVLKWEKFYEKLSSVF
jgi:hypothetical protein